MDFIGRYNQWYCPVCREYDPQSNIQHFHKTQSPDRRRKTIILITVIIVTIIIIAAIGYIFYKSNQISVKVLNNSNDQLGVTIFIDGYWSDEKYLDPNEDIVFTDTGHQKGQKYEIRLKFKEPISEKIHSKEITTDNDVTFTIQEDYNITVTTA